MKEKVRGKEKLWIGIVQHADFLEHGGIRLLNGCYNGSHAKAITEMYRNELERKKEKR
jgi:hypothetical protein